MISLLNKKNTVLIDKKVLKKDAQKILDLLDYSDFDLAILLTNNITVQKYNREYRDKDVPTDILSFPFHELLPGQRIEPKTEEDKNLGDLIISVEYVQKLYPDNLYERMQTLLVHGICHLLGHDHDTEKTDKEMLALEDFLLLKLQEKK